MATVRMIQREKRIQKKIENNKSKRLDLKKIIKSKDSSPEEVIQAVLTLDKRSADESPVRHMRRCNCCGRPHGVYRKMGLCRACIRKAFTMGYLPGWTMSSW